MAVGRGRGLQLDSRRCGRVCTRSDEAVRLLAGIRGDHGDAGMGSEDGCWGWGSISTHQLALSMHPERRGSVHWLCDDSKRNAATAKAWVDELERAEFSWAAANHSHTLAWCLPCPSAACPGGCLLTCGRRAPGHASGQELWTLALRRQAAPLQKHCLEASRAQPATLCSVYNRSPYPYPGRDCVPSSVRLQLVVATPPTLG